MADGEKEDNGIGRWEQAQQRAETREEARLDLFKRDVTYREGSLEEQRRANIEHEKHLAEFNAGNGAHKENVALSREQNAALVRIAAALEKIAESL